ncbi:NOT2 family protein [Pleomassaria siparia CBS 279.74]|uniref:NOT2 family protein n=1 Tax=Pleomassaria siparia CBS 279.74 TaxID=1314801 RepID=A0A6G1JYI8_9PLEO|nr:NOT2 family protein [Pleomassaria siparia CBS 279.74]
MFPNQPNSGTRGAPLGANRLQNGKLGTGSQWAFGGPMGGAPGLSNAQSRTNGGGLSSFAQTIGSSQPHTPLNLEEFPSLSGASQAQQNTSAQQMWSNPNLRTTQQHSTIQRPQGQPSSQGQPGPSTAQQLQNQTHEDVAGPVQSQFSGGGDEYRFGGQGGVGQLSGGTQPQTGNIEEFPPLGGGAGEIGPDRRTGMIQNAAAFGGSANAAFPGLGQTRNGLPSPTDGQDRSINTAVGSRGIHPGAVSRTPFENMRGTTGVPDVERNGNSRAGQTLANMANLSFIGSQLPQLRGSSDIPPVGQRQQSTQFDQTFGADTLGSPNAQASQHKKLSDMTESERYGLPGLLSMIPLDSPDYSSLAVGQDLTVLGLDLSRPDNSPLHPTFGSPFVESNVKPVIPPGFTLPAAYTVSNVPPLHSKMSSFSSETLLAIFYQYPRDIMQEIAANELYNRDWRWHMELQQWMMKDPDLPQPMRLSQKEERGWYLFFDVTNWRRERREFELNYDHLDQRHGPAMAGQM